MRDWFSEAQELRNKGYGYLKIAKTLGLSVNTVKNRFQRLERKQKNLNNLKQNVIKELNKGCNVNEIIKKFKIGKEQVNKIFEEIEKDGFDLEKIDGMYVIRKYPQEQSSIKNFKLNEGWHLIGVVSDTHLNSKHQQLTYLNKIYDIFESEGVTNVLNCGDVCAGFGMYKGQEFEVFNLGADAQLNYMEQLYPKRKNIKTYVIAGNHDLSFYNKLGFDIIKKLAFLRNDIEYLGQYGAYLKLAEGALVYMLHPDSGQSYAISYKPQKIANSIPYDSKPDIMLIGHYHQAEYIFEKDIHIVQCGSFEGQTPYLKRKGISPKIGGWLIEFKIDNGTITRFKPELFTFKKELSKDY